MASRMFGISASRRLIVAVAVALALAVPAEAQKQLDEYDVKAAFLYNLIKFVEWPDPAGQADAIVIGVYGRDAFLTIRDVVMKAKKSTPRDVVVRQLNAEDEAKGCHIVFISESESRRTVQILRLLGDSGVLTVGETANFLDEGGLVRFYVHANRVRFQIDSVGAQLGGLKISSQLLSLAK